MTKPLAALIAGALFFVSFSSEASLAGTVVLSGDVTPAYSLTGDTPNSPEPGNRRFFLNVLNGGTNVVVLSSSFGSPAHNEIRNFYNGLPGVSGAVVAPEIEVSDLNEADLFVVPKPSSPFSSTSIDSIAAFVRSGGTLLLLGEADAESFGFGSTTNSYINQLLAGIGSSMSLNNGNYDIGSRVAQGDQIALHDLTSEVESYSYGAASEVLGGTPVFLSTDGLAFTAIETLVVPEPCLLIGWAFILFKLNDANRKRSRRLRRPQG